MPPRGRRPATPAAKGEPSVPSISQRLRHSGCVCEGVPLTHEHASTVVTRETQVRRWRIENRTPNRPEKRFLRGVVIFA